MLNVKILQPYFQKLCLLLLMLAYVVIPHEGDFRDSLSLVTGVQPTHVAQESGLSPLQGLLSGMALNATAPAHPCTASAHALVHPELFQTTRGAELQQPAATPLVWAMSRHTATVAHVYAQTRKPPPLKPPHRQTVLLLI
jgi:hypothetical protein